MLLGVVLEAVPGGGVIRVVALVGPHFLVTDTAVPCGVEIVFSCAVSGRAVAWVGEKSVVFASPPMPNRSSNLLCFAASRVSFLVEDKSGKLEE